MHVVVIGSGIIGAATAWLLAQQGAAVTLLDAHDKPAQGASHANGGQLSYSYVAPLAGPGVLPDLPGWLLSDGSPLRFLPRLDPHQWHWCLQFAAACRASVAEASTAQMLSLSYLSRDTLAQWLAQAPFEFSHVRNGKLIVYRSAALLEKARRQVEYQVSLGAQQRVLNAAEVLALEPALAGMGRRLAGAVHTPDEEAGDCHALTGELVRDLARQPGAVVRLGVRVRRLVRGDGRIRAVLLDSGENLEAEHFVVAAGQGSRQLLLPLGVRLPLYPLRGYSLSIPLAADDSTVPAISVTDYERRIVYARLGNMLRVAAMVDIGAEGAAPDPHRIALLKRQVAELFPHLNLAAASAWAGDRPATPGGKPLIGRVRAASNLWLNTGHGALGFTLACGSASLLAAQMAGAAPPIDPTPFLP